MQVGSEPNRCKIVGSSSRSRTQGFIQFYFFSVKKVFPCFNHGENEECSIHCKETILEITGSNPVPTTKKNENKMLLVRRFGFIPCKSALCVQE